MDWKKYVKKTASVIWKGFLFTTEVVVTLLGLIMWKIVDVVNISCYKEQDYNTFFPDLGKKLQELFLIRFSKKAVEVNKELSKMEKELSKMEKTKNENI